MPYTREGKMSIERTGELGRIADELDQIRAQIQDTDRQADEAIAQLQSVDSSLRDRLARTVRQQFIDVAAQLQLRFDHLIQKRADLREERRGVEHTAAECQRFLAENAEQAARGERANQLIQEAIALLDRDRDWEVIPDLGRTGARLPAKMEQTRANLRAAERRLAELGEE